MRLIRSPARRQGDIIHGFGGCDMPSGGDVNDTIDSGAGTDRFDLALATT